MESVKRETAGPARAGRREWVGLGVLSIACLVYVMDLTVLHLAVPKLSADLQPTSSQLLWIIDIYGFVVAGSLITMGTLGVPPQSETIANNTAGSASLDRGKICDDPIPAHD